MTLCPATGEGWRFALWKLEEFESKVRTLHIHPECILSSGLKSRSESEVACRHARSCMECHKIAFHPTKSSEIMWNSPNAILGGSSHDHRLGGLVLTPLFHWDFCRVNPLPTGVNVHPLRIRGMDPAHIPRSMRRYEKRMDMQRCGTRLHLTGNLISLGKIMLMVYDSPNFDGICQMMVN